MPVLTSRLLREPSVAGFPILTGIPLCSPNIHLQLAAVVDFPNAHHDPRGMARRAVNHRPRVKKSRVRIEQCLESTDDRSVREREHFMDKLAIAEYKASHMGDKSITKVGAATAPRGPMGQKYLASGIRLSMRIWERESPDTQPKAETTANYETAGYVIAGRAELHIEGQVVDLEPGDSWIVPKGSRHSYKILEAFTALEATTPPAEVHGRDKSEPAG